MIEILESFEQVAGRLSPVVLIGPGLAMVVLGLVAWLAGMCLRRIVPAFFGAGVAALVSFFMGGQSLAVAGVAVGGGAAFGAILRRLFMAALLAVFGMGVVFAAVAKPHLLEGRGTLFGAQGSGRAEEGFTVRESLDAVRAYAFDTADRIEAAARELAPIDWAVIVAVGSGLLMLGLFFEWPMGALTCSLLGTALIFGGLMLLLMYKGSGPIARVEQRGAVYGLVLVGMAAFGTLEQLLVCRRPQRAAQGKAGTSHAKEESKRGWRSR